VAALGATDHECRAGGARDDQDCPKPSIRRGSRRASRGMSDEIVGAARAAVGALGAGAAPPHPLAEQIAQDA
jgi:hypothetical protein